MSALLIDDLMVDEIEGDEPSVLLRSGGLDGSSMASVTTLPVVRPAQTASGWHLTDRGIAVVLSLFVGLFLTGVVVAVTSFLAVSDAPLAVDGADVATVSVLR